MNLNDRKEKSTIMEKEQFIKLLLNIIRGNRIWTIDFLEQEAIKLFPDITNVNEFSTTKELTEIINRHSGLLNQIKL